MSVGTRQTLGRHRVGRSDWAAMRVPSSMPTEEPRLGWEPGVVGAGDGVGLSGWLRMEVE